MSRSSCRALGCLLLVALVGVPLNPLVAEGPISEEELLALVTTTRLGAVTSERVVEIDPGAGDRLSGQGHPSAGTEGPRG